MEGRAEGGGAGRGPEGSKAGRGAGDLEDIVEGGKSGWGLEDTFDVSREESESIVKAKSAIDKSSYSRAGRGYFTL